MKKKKPNSDQELDALLMVKRETYIASLNALSIYIDDLSEMYMDFYRQKQSADHPAFAHLKTQIHILKQIQEGFSLGLIGNVGGLPNKQPGNIN